MAALDGIRAMPATAAEKRPSYRAIVEIWSRDLES
jgi:hypothetical protein